MDRLHLSDSTLFPSRKRTVTFPLILLLLTELHQNKLRKHFWAVASHPSYQQSSKKLLSLQRTLADRPDNYGVTGSFKQADKNSNTRALIKQAIQHYMVYHEASILSLQRLLGNNITQSITPQ